ncbi:deoxynucleoside kinase [Marinifilum caeruleilacunae]|uniref:Deoxynucleoside kinase n=1 Tax=Marinifilum caeruleilacunae TaxID=2499076 RepID=A0ABX1WWS7_9BACT|nr:deoxynucleoside kinase [Marinifilum caeruleilacunae]NOU60534.1 deoxynucleoside kinase [Marinifilum caeruleilacunae]
MHIAVAGNIGSGKTTLTELLAKHYGWEAHYEDVDENPYLNDFYDDMQRWSFNLQIYFLKSRFTQIMEIRNSGKNVVQDRTIFEDAKIFAPNLYDMGLMSERDFTNYCNLFQLMSSMVQAPDLLIYLRSSVPTLVNQIQKRGRDYEETIRLDYLKNLNDRYENWISNYKNGNLLIVDADNIDFLENPADLNSIVDKVEAKIHGLF